MHPPRVPLPARHCATLYADPPARPSTAEVRTRERASEIICRWHDDTLKMFGLEPATDVRGCVTDGGSDIKKVQWLLAHICRSAKPVA